MAVDISTDRNLVPPGGPDRIRQAVQEAGDLAAVQSVLRARILDVCDADMATVYVAKVLQGKIFSWLVLPGDHLRKITVPIDSGSVAGFVAMTGKSVNVGDAYDLEQLAAVDSGLAFNRSWDSRAGVRTRQILAVPISFRNSVLGVAQFVNKQSGGVFTVDDLRCAHELSDTLGQVFCRHFQRARQLSPLRKFALLLKEQGLSQQDLLRALSLARTRKADVVSILHRDFNVPMATIGKAIAANYEIPFVELGARPVPPCELTEGINMEYFRRIKCIPFEKKGGRIFVAIHDPDDQATVQEVIRLLRPAEVRFCFALRDEIGAYIDRCKPGAPGRGVPAAVDSVDQILSRLKEEGAGQQSAGQVEVETGADDDRAIVMLVRQIIEDAYRNRASDIHIEPYGFRQDAEVRFRVDGQCFKVCTIPRHSVRAVISRFKILARLDISERRKPQDGKIACRTGDGSEIELRMATLPTAGDNEDVVLRILSRSRPLPLAQIMPPAVFKRFEEIIRKPHGIVLVVGPTGSGKTTTLHSALGHINTPELKIWTAEDPVEITQYRLRQVQVNPKIGLTFASAMRAFLRADPDVIMVGEMRDSETARMGIEASLTGHLVLSTLHTNSAAETITRLVDMGMDPFNFADALLGVLAQRLVRTLCPDCKQSYRPTRFEYEQLRRICGERFETEVGVAFSEDPVLQRAGGCAACKNTGYRGRTGLYELLIASDAIKKAVVERARAEEIRRLAMQEGMATLLQEGIRRIFDGSTDLKQVMSVCGL